MVSAFSEVNKVDVPYEIAPRRDGDIAACYADTRKAKEVLGWEAKHELPEMVESAYNFVLKNKGEE
jgi:UDP-glucose 4-epimerase